MFSNEKEKVLKPNLWNELFWSLETGSLEDDYFRKIGDTNSK